MQAAQTIVRKDVPSPFGRAPIAPPSPAEPPRFEDTRFRSLLSAHDWARLPEAVRRRFSKRVSDGATIIYKGRVIAIEYSRIGYLLAQMLRLLGAPMPLTLTPGLESVVTVTEDRSCQGQFWTRMFARERGFPQMIHSVKRFAGVTGIEEVLPFGIVMALRLSVENGALCFNSAGYALCIGPARVRLPAWLTPGCLTVTHANVDNTTFVFSMTLRHPWFGRLLHQEASYQEDVR